MKKCFQKYEVKLDFYTLPGNNISAKNFIMANNSFEQKTTEYLRILTQREITAEQN